MKIKDGTHQTPTYCDSKSGFPFLSSKDITSEKINWDNIKYIVPDLHRELYARIAPQKDDVLLAKNGTTGVAALVEDDRVFDIYVTLAVLRPNQKIVLPNYLLRIVNSPICKSQFDSHLKGMGVPNLHLNEIQKVLIPVPPLAEQKRIVKTLDEKFAKIDKLKNAAEINLKNAREIFNAELNSKLNVENENLPQGREKKYIREIVEKIQNIKWDKFPQGQELFYIDLSSVNKDNQQIEEVSSVNRDNAPSRAKQIILENDVIFATTRPTQKRVCVIPNEYNGQICSTGFCVLRPKDKITSNYLFYCLLTEGFYSYIRPLEKGANYPAVSDSVVKDFQIPLPPLSEQKRIVAHLDKLSEKVKRLEEIYRRTITDCEELKKSILKQTFEGGN